MPTYRVTWEIDIECDTPREAAQQARAYQQKLDAWTHDVMEHDDPTGNVHHIDLDEEEGE